MKHERDLSLYFDNRTMDYDIVNVNFNLISHLKQQLQMHRDDPLHRCLNMLHLSKWYNKQY